MKKTFLKITTLMVLAGAIAMNCSKKEDPAPAATTSGTTTSGTTTSGSTTGGNPNNLQNNQWSANGIIYNATVFPNNLYWGKDIHGTCYLSASTIVGDTTITIQYRFPSYLMASGSYNIVTASSTFTSNVVNVSINKSFPTAPYFINNYVTTGGMATITNAGGIFTIESSNVGLNNMNLSSKLSTTVPVIPSTNASYSEPVGFTANQYTVGTTAYTTNQLVISYDASGSFKFEGSLTSTPQKTLKYWFSSSFPPSGTYDVVDSKSALAAGKIYIEFISFSPIEQYNSLVGKTATVITNSNDVSVTVNNVELIKVIGSGSQTLSLSGNLTH
ncbi:MAG: hypothetical protein EAZ07_00630 [Cytophagales bacterium]|nr:MAG: hypothetical protein EAZ07_00630 [Cytophagales bacterium]